MSPAIVSGIVTGDAPISYWTMFSRSLVTVPEVIAKVKSAQFPGPSVNIDFVLGTNLTIASLSSALQEGPSSAPKKCITEGIRP